MARLGVVFFSFLLSPCCLGSNWEQYVGYQELSVLVSSPTHYDILRELDETAEVILLSEIGAVGRQTSMAVGPESIGFVLETFRENNVEFVVKNEDISQHLRAVWEETDLGLSATYNYTAYNDLATTYTELDTLASLCHSDLTCTTSSIGFSVENREIRMLEIKKAGNTQSIYVDSTTHAREWMSLATMMNIFNEMITAYPTGANTTMLMSYDWYFVPVANPDGYSYTWTDDMLWRKNRAPNDGLVCEGVDVNRNFDINWAEPGAYNLSCSQVYHGPSAASEPETVAIKNQILSIQQESELRAVWSVHGYGSAFLYPYGNCSDPAGGPELDRMTNVICDAIEKTHNTSWDCGNTCRTWYEASGLTIDWTVGGGPGVLYSWTPEVRGESFTPPASEINLSFTEMYSGLQAMAFDMLP